MNKEELLKLLEVAEVFQLFEILESKSSKKAHFKGFRRIPVKPRFLSFSKDALNRHTVLLNLDIVAIQQNDENKPVDSALKESAQLLVCPKNASNVSDILISIVGEHPVDFFISKKEVEKAKRIDPLNFKSQKDFDELLHELKEKPILFNDYCDDVRTGVKFKNYPEVTLSTIKVGLLSRDNVGMFGYLEGDLKETIYTYTKNVRHEDPLIEGHLLMVGFGGHSSQYDIGHVGRTAVVDKKFLKRFLKRFGNELNLYPANFLIWIKPGGTKRQQLDQELQPYYLAAALNSDFVRKQIKIKCNETTSTQYHINSQDVKSLLIKDMPLYKMNKIAKNYRDNILERKKLDSALEELRAI